MEKIILVDGHNLLFRMFYGIPAPIKNSYGKDIRGLIGFIGSLKRIVEEFKPYSLLIIFDSQTSKDNNLEIDKEYKSNRIDYSNVKEEENPFSQLDIIKKALDFLNIFHLEVDGYEADDFIASVVSREDNEYQYIIVSTDSDFLQLVNENVFVYVPRGKKSVLYNKEEVMKRYNVTPEKYVLFKSLVGDRSDNVKGVKGIGKVTAKKIVNCNSLQDFISNSNLRLSKLVLENEELIRKNQSLIELNREMNTTMIEIKELSQNIYNMKTYEIIENIGEC